MEQESFDLMMKGRAIVDAHKNNPDKNNSPEEMTRSIDKMNLELKNLGFYELQYYANWDKKKTLEVYKECRPIIGACDLCGQKEAGDQICVGIYKENSCAFSQPDKPYDALYLYVMNHEIEKKDFDKLITCPDGHGFHRDIENYKTLPIDIRWKVFA